MVLEATPGLTKEEIAERAFVSKTTLSGGGYLKSMRNARLIHISGWRRNGSSSFSTPVYSAGDEKDLPRPKITANTRQAPGMLRLLDAIHDFGPIDYRQAAQIAGLSANTVKNAGYLDSLLAQRKIHIAEWRRNRHGAPCALYEFGPGKNASRPPVLSQAERSKLHRLRSSPPTASLATQFNALIAAIPCASTEG